MPELHYTLWSRKKDSLWPYKAHTSGYEEWHWQYMFSNIAEFIERPGNAEGELLSQPSN